MELTTKQVQKLKGIAQRLDATLKVGKSGLSDSFLSAVNVELDRHELVKIKFAEFKEERREMAKDLAEKTGSNLLTVVGHVAVFFKRHADPEKRRVAVD